MKPPNTRQKNIIKSSLLFAASMVGIILVWRGLWDISEAYMTPIQSLGLGAIILLVIGFFFRKFLKRRLL